MAQDNYVVDSNDPTEVSGSGVRGGINSALAAIVSQNSGATEPSTTYAYMLWADTTTGLIKQRNAANNAWITIGTMASTNWGLSTNFIGSESTVTGASGDKIAILDASDSSAAKYITSIPAALVGADFVSGQTEETSVDSAADFMLLHDTSAGALRKVKPENIGAGGGAWTVISSTDITGTTASVEFTGLDSTYESYAVVFTGVEVDTDAVYLYAVVYSGGSYQTSNYTYTAQTYAAGAGASSNGATGLSQWQHGEASANTYLGTGAGESLNATLILYDPANTSAYTGWTFVGSYQSSNSTSVSTFGGGSWQGTGAVTQIKFYPSSGNFDGGRITLYGINHS
jgi:hypothetical protein